MLLNGQSRVFSRPDQEFAKQELPDTEARFRAIELRSPVNRDD